MARAGPGRAARAGTRGARGLPEIDFANKEDADNTPIEFQKNMKSIADMKATITELKTAFASFLSDKASATSAALTDFQTKLSGLDAAVNGALTQAQADLLTAQASIKSLGAELTAANLNLETLNSALTAAAGELKLELKADATATDKITALKNGVSTTLARAGFPASQVPAAPPSKGGEKNVLTRAEFSALSPAAKMGFVKAGGTLTD